MAARAQLRIATPPGYRWQQHVGLIASFVLIGFAVTVAQLDGLQAGDAPWLVVLLGFLNFGEYAIHRWSLHRRVFPRILYHRHVVEHHGFFTYDTMAVDTWTDLRWVLFPWWALPLLVLTVMPLFSLLLVVAPARVGWLFLLTVTVYYGGYEILHALAHLPDEHQWARRPWVRALTHHHRVHHEPRLMRRYNFNFVVPCFDALFRTTYREEVPTQDSREAIR